jgi:hypothetical protein
VIFGDSAANCLNFLHSLSRRIHVVVPEAGFSALPRAIDPEKFQETSKIKGHVTRAGLRLVSQ